MPPQLALFVYVFLIVSLVARDRKLRPMTSWALWVPLLWLLIIGSRPVSFWLTGEIQYKTPEDYLEGSPLDAGVFLILIVSGLVILLRRKVEWDRILSSNRWLFAFFFYCFVSFIWSDYPFVLFKRWIKDCGSVIMVLVILTEKDHVAAIRAVFARYAYFVIPLSVLFIKYFPEFGRAYDRWTWKPIYVGVTSEKNALGALVLISGLFLIWDLIEKRTKRQGEQSETGRSAVSTRVRAPAQRRDGSHIVTSSQREIHGEARSASGGDAIAASRRSTDKVDLAGRVFLLLMVVWLIDKADSSNALVCLILGIGIIFAMSRPDATKHIRYLGTYTLILVFLVLLLYSVPGVLETVLGMLGEDATLTGRTDLWADLLNEPINPFLGAGYQSFWLGSGAERMWEKYYFHPNQAHNGYLDTYLNGGVIGVFLFIAMIVSTGRKLKQELLLRASGSILLVSFFIVTLFYNWSEAMFNRLSPVWIIMLLAALNYPRSSGASREIKSEGTNGKRISARPSGNLGGLSFKALYIEPEWKNHE